LSRAAPALATLPVFLVLAAFVTGMNLAIDATAGERERRSLEALLVSPASTTTIVAGKWLVAAALSGVGIAATLAAARAVLTSTRIVDPSTVDGLRTGLQFRRPGAVAHDGLTERDVVELDAGLGLPQ
jgi:ABC-type Na+ efflux pump permease subunit